MSCSRARATRDRRRFSARAHAATVTLFLLGDNVVRAGGGSDLLRQAYVDHIGHCNFTSAELVAGVEAIRHRVETGRWDSVAQPKKLQEVATSLGLDGASFIHYQPSALSGDNGPFDPVRNAVAAD